MKLDVPPSADDPLIRWLIVTCDGAELHLCRAFDTERGQALIVESDPEPDGQGRIARVADERPVFRIVRGDIAATLKRDAPAPARAEYLRLMGLTP